MKFKGKFESSNIKSNRLYVSTSLMKKLRQVKETKEPIDTSSPTVYTERKDGVKPGFDIRTDRWEIAQQSFDKMARDEVAKRDAVAGSDVQVAGSDVQKEETKG